MYVFVFIYVYQHVKTTDLCHQNKHFHPWSLWRNDGVEQIISKIGILPSFNTYQTPGRRANFFFIGEVIAILSYDVSAMNLIDFAFETA